MKDNIIYVLCSDETPILGAFSSRKSLSKAVDHYIKIDPERTMYFKAFFKDYIPGDATKTCWAYIGKGCILPSYIEIGINLVGKPEDDICLGLEK